MRISSFNAPATRVDPSRYCRRLLLDLSAQWGGRALLLIATLWGGAAAAQEPRGDYSFAPWQGHSGSGSGYGSTRQAPWYGPSAPGQPQFAPGGGGAPYPQYRFRDAPEMPQQEASPYPRFRPFSMDGKGYPQVPPGYGWQGSEGMMVPPPVFRPLNVPDEPAFQGGAPGWGNGPSGYPPLPSSLPMPWEEVAPDYGSPYPPW
jgi:hypothetical protein